MSDGKHHRRQDLLRLIRGEGRYSDDLKLPGRAAAVFVRSPHAAARILSIECEEAAGHLGVIAILTAADMTAAGVGNITRTRNFPGAGPDAMKVPFRPALAADRVCHVGQCVALVVARDAQTALDAADLVLVDYDELPAIVTMDEAVAAGARQLWPEAPGNIALDWPGPVEDGGQRARKVDEVFASAARIAAVEVINQRIVGAPLEPRSASAAYDPDSGRYTLYCGSQGAAGLGNQMSGVMNVAPGDIRVISGDVGGAFGLKTPAYPEYAALLVAARKTGRPVHWVSSRSEAFVSDNQGRDTVTRAELALDEDGMFLALRVRAMANMGAVLSSESAYIASANFGRCFPTVYNIPHIDVSVRCVLTNTVTTGPYRGAGRPEANYAMERLVEEAARLTGIDPIALRRRNMIGADMMPFATDLECVFDSGEFEVILDKALERANYAGFGERRAASSARGKLRGIGVSCFLEHAGGPPIEPAGISFPGDGKVCVTIGTQAGGQGHGHLFSRLTARQLEIDAGPIEVRYGDSDFAVRGLGTVASRSAMMVGSALFAAAARVIEKGREAAALALEAAEADIDYGEGFFTIGGTDRRISLIDAAARATAFHADGRMAETLDSLETAKVPQSFPNGCHIAEVEIDPETGVVSLLSFVAVDDCGEVLDPPGAKGQIIGGIAQAVGQALVENAVYDDTGQLVTGSFMDYGLPRADDMPTIDSEFHVVPCTTNPLGVKGVGEAGTTGGLAAVMNAIINAVPGSPAIDMPATPEKIWRACQTK